MRILLPGPLFPDTFVDNVAYTLRSLGHEVLTMPAVSHEWYGSRVRAYYELVRGKLSSSYLSPAETWVISNARKSRPDMLLCLTTAIKEEALVECRRAGVKDLVAWWADPPANMQGHGVLSELWTVIFLKDRDAVQKLRRVGLNSELLHEAMNPAWHRRVSDQSHEKIAVVGNFYNHRQFLVRKLIRDGVNMDLYGGHLPNWTFDEIKLAHTGKYVTRDEKSRVFGASMAVLNSTSFAEGNSLNCRAFEIAGAAGLQLLEHRTIVHDCFEPGKELLTFDAYDELLSHIERARRAPQEMLEIRLAGMQRALREHTYANRFERMFSILERLRR